MCWMRMISSFERYYHDCLTYQFRWCVGCFWLDDQVQEYLQCAQFRNNSLPILISLHHCYLQLWADVLFSSISDLELSDNQGTWLGVYGNGSRKVDLYREVLILVPRGNWVPSLYLSQNCCQSQVLLISQAGCEFGQLTFLSLIGLSQ